MLCEILFLIQPRFFCVIEPTGTLQTIAPNHSFLKVLKQIFFRANSVIFNLSNNRSYGSWHVGLVIFSGLVNVLWPFLNSNYNWKVRKPDFRPIDMCQVVTGKKCGTSKHVVAWLALLCSSCSWFWHHHNRISIHLRLPLTQTKETTHVHALVSHQTLHLPFEVMFC